MQKGSFILDLYDGKNKSRYGRRTPLKRTTIPRTLGKKGKNIAKAMSTIFKNYPVRGN